jgi:hypothetical protein
MFVFVRFVNLCAEDVSLRWLDFSGTQVEYATLRPEHRYFALAAYKRDWVTRWTCIRKRKKRI